MPRSEAASLPVEARMTEIVFPDHTNHLGTLFGGQALAWMDKAAYLAAVRHAGGVVVTVCSERVEFRRPVKLGDVIDIDASIRRCGRSSITVDVALWRTQGSHRELATQGSFVMVAVDEQGKARLLPA
jgi:acyl-CoA hydrolase